MEKAALKIEDTSAAFYIVRLLAFQPFIHRPFTFNTPPTTNDEPNDRRQRATYMSNGYRRAYIVSPKIKRQKK